MAHCVVHFWRSSQLQSHPSLHFESALVLDARRRDPEPRTATH